MIVHAAYYTTHWWSYLVYAGAIAVVTPVWLRLTAPSYNRRVRSNRRESSMSQDRTVNVYLTSEVIRYLNTAGDGSTEPNAEDLVITTVDDRGGVFVERASCAGEDGSGVWVDASGQEHLGPGGEFTESIGAVEHALELTR